MNVSKKRLREIIREEIQTLNERASRGELDISAISIHAYAHVCDQYALLPSGASMGDGYGPMLVAREAFSKEEIAARRIAVPGTMTSAFLALQLSFAGKLISIVSDNVIGAGSASLLMGAVIVIYVGLIGIRSMIYIDTFQFFHDDL